MNMRIMNQLIFVLLLLITSVANAKDDSGYGTNIAIEIRNDNKFIGHIGKLEYTGLSLDMVTFSSAMFGTTRIVVLPDVCIITNMKVVSKGVHNISCDNQYGATSSGTIDFRDETKPKITIVRQGGQVITNISDEGRKWQKNNIPNVMLGQ